MDNRDYYIGLDIGTSSVGWAVTDENYKLLRAKGKDLWGVRLFPEAQTAAERRGKRTSRRRLQREKARKAVLKELFAEEIEKIDPCFYIKLKESNLWEEDRSSDNVQPYSLFNDKEYTDREFYRDYPTIFRLRKALIEQYEKFDIRLIFLAILNMFGHRGHFLNHNLDTEKETWDFSTSYSELIDILKVVGIEGMPETVDLKDLQEKLVKKDSSRSAILEDVSQLFNISKKEKQLYSILKLFVGLTVKTFELTGNENLKKEEKNIAICFRDSNYDEKIEDFHNIVGDEYLEVVTKAKEIHDAGLLSSIMGGFNYLSEARVQIYEEHKEDLRNLKELLKEYNRKAYVELFRKIGKGSYSAYVGSVNSYGKIIRRKKDLKNKKTNDTEGRNKEDLYKKIKDALNSIPDTNEIKGIILSKIEAGNFLEKQLTAFNGVIPNQVHCKELKAILKNAGKHYEFLNKKDKNGISVSDKIVQLFEFQVPYYVGPIAQQHKNKKNSNVWSVRKEGGKVYPWNFEEKIDLKASAEEFISRMVRRCTYFSEESTLPNQSLLYEKFKVLNEINNLKVDGKPISVKAKQQLFEKEFLKGKKVSGKRISEFLQSLGEMGKDSVLSGIDGNCNQALTLIGKFYGVFGDDVYNDSYQTMIEEIIFWATIYGDDKKFLREKIVEKYSDRIDDKKLKRILGFKIKGWGNLSKEFLELEGTSKEDGTVESIIQALWNTNSNLNALLSSKYTYVDELNKRISKVEKTLSNWQIEDLDDMYLSAPVKRMVWQTMKIVEELVSVMGCSPKRIFVEMTRGDGIKGKKEISRKEKLSALYKAIDKEQKIWTEEIANKPEQEFKSKKLYLYCLQKGKCMYSGDPIPFSDLMDNNLYDIDHIYPQSLVKDDSIENNLVLVKKEINSGIKRDAPISSDIQKKCWGFWKTLREQGFMNQEKYSRLTRKLQTFTDEEKAGFINRQLVETGQATRCITQIFLQGLPESKIIFNKAALVSDFRHKFDIPKARCINDFHHANDAYLNIVVGNAYYVKFTNNPRNFIKNASVNKDAYSKYHISKFFEYNIASREETAWVVSDENKTSTISTVKTTLAKNSPLITYKCKEEHDSLFDDTIYGKHKASQESYIGIKTKNSPLANVYKYGGKTSISTRGYCLIEYTVGQKKARKLESIPMYLGSITTLTEDTLQQYYIEKLQYDDVAIIKKFIPMDSIVEVNGFKYRLGGRTGNRIMVYPLYGLILDEKWNKYYQKIEKAISKKYYDEIDKKTGKNILSKAENIELYKILMDKFENSIFSKRVNTLDDTLKKGEIKFTQLSIEEQCNILESIALNFSKSQPSNLSNIEGSGKAGVCLISMEITKYQTCILINQSCTGLFVYKEDLLR